MRRRRGRLRQDREKAMYKGCHYDFERRDESRFFHHPGGNCLGEWRGWKCLILFLGWKGEGTEIFWTNFLYL